MKIPCPTEDFEQIRVADWLRANGVFFHHSNRKGQRRVQHIMKEARLGSLKGFPDLLVFDPPPRGGRTHISTHPVGSFTYQIPFVGVAIEMKRKKGGKVSAAQSIVIDELARRGWLTRICYGADEAITFLKSCGYGVRK